MSGKNNRILFYIVKIILVYVLIFPFNVYTQTVHLVKDIRTGEFSSSLRGFAKMQDVAYFWATDTIDQQIWVTDGSESGTYKITDLEFPEWNNVPVAVSDSLLIFISSNGENGLELFYSDGTIGSGDMLIDLNQGSLGGIVQFGRGDGSYAYFIGKQPKGLYRTDGTTDGTIQLTNGNEDGLREMLQFNGSNFTRIYSQGYMWLLKTDGTVEGTEFITQIVEGYIIPQNLNIVVFNEALYFLKESPGEGWGLWKSEGTAESMEMILQLNPDGFYSPYDLIATSDKLFFVANDGVNGTELWVSDGTAEGTVIVTNYNDLNTSVLPSDLTSFGDKILFINHDNLSGFELWSSDGSTEGTQIVKDIWPGEESSNTNLVGSVILDSLIFFTAKSPSGIGLWRSNGTEEGTFMVMNIYPGSSASFFSLLFKLDEERFLFKAYTPDLGSELWIYSQEIETTVEEPLDKVHSFINVYPNPVTNHQSVFINWPRDISPVAYEIYNLYGKIVKSSRIQYNELNEMKISTDNFQSGIYFINLRNLTGEIIAYSKLMVH